MIYNVQMFPLIVPGIGEARKPTFTAKARTRQLAEADIFGHTDLVVFVEAFDSDLMLWLSKKLSSRFPYRSTPDNEYIGSGIFVVSRYPLEGQYNESYPEACGFDKFASKGFKYFKVKSNPEVQIIGTHLQAGDPLCAKGRAESIRRNQIKQIRKFIDRKDKSLGMYVLGDFNFDSSSDEFHDALQVLNTKYSPKGDLVYSFDSDKNDYLGMEKSVIANLDFVFEIQDFPQTPNWVNYILNPKNAKGYKYCNRKLFSYSDHFPVIGTAGEIEYDNSGNVDVCDGIDCGCKNNNCWAYCSVFGPIDVFEWCYTQSKCQADNDCKFNSKCSGRCSFF